MGPKIKTESCWSPQTPLGDKFLHGAIVPAIAYQYTKIQLPSSISSGDMEGVLKLKLQAAVPPTWPLDDKFLCRALVLVNAYECAEFQLPSFISSISYEDMERVPK